MLKINKEFCQEFGERRNLSKNSIKVYLSCVNSYTNFHGLTMQELITEADEEEEQGIRAKKRTLKKRLEEWRQDLINQNLSKVTIRQRMTNIKAIYRFYEIEIPNLSFINDKQMKQYEPIMFKDLPTKSIIRQALYYADPCMSAIILLESSSGMGRREVLNLKVEDFIKATGINYQGKDVVECIDDLYFADKDIVPIWKLERQKTKKYYYTFCTTECVRAIIYYLMTRKDLEYDAPLFKISENHYYTKFKELNDVLNLGEVGGRSVFRGHMLRKFNASHLRMGNNPLTIDEIDSIQGRSKNTVQESYFMDDPRTLWKKYIMNMNEVMINASSIAKDRTQLELDKATAQVDKLTQLWDKRLELANKLIIENPQDA